MPEFDVTAPDGRTFRVTAPEGASEADVLGYAKSQFAMMEQKPAEPSALKKLFTPTPVPGDASWVDVPGLAARNLLPSAAKFGHDLVQPVVAPIETATNLKNLGLGVLQKMGQMSPQLGQPAAIVAQTVGKFVPAEYEKYADAVGKFLVDRYGSAEAVKKTLASDPVGVAGDVSTVLSGGGIAAARAPGVIGKIGEAASAAGRATNPLTLPMAATGKIASNVIGGFGTNTGPKVIESAFEAGAAGGQKSAALTDSMRGNTQATAIVAEARGALDQMRNDRQAAYQSGMLGVKADATPLNFSKIDQAVQDATNVATFKGQTGTAAAQSLSPSTQAIRKTLTDEINAWKALDPAEFHTAAGLDALKRKVGDIRDATQYGTAERVVADKVYRAIWQTVSDQVPGYAKVMKGFEEASNLIREIEDTLSLGKRGSVDTALRKLTSVMRNNVNTNYGRRGELAGQLSAAGAPNLMEGIAGQSLNSWIPRGLGTITGGGAILGAFSNPWTLAALPFTSPRLMGEAAHLTGRVAGPVRGGSLPAYQSGQLNSAPMLPRSADAEQQPNLASLPPWLRDSLAMR